MDFEEGRLPSIMQVGLIQSAEDLNRRKEKLSWSKKVFCKQTAIKLELQHCRFLGGQHDSLLDFLLKCTCGILAYGVLKKVNGSSRVQASEARKQSRPLTLLLTDLDTALTPCLL